MSKVSQMIPIGKFGSPFGVKGILHFEFFTRNKDIPKYRLYYLYKKEEKLFEKCNIKFSNNGNGVKADVSFVQDREEASKLTNRNIYIDKQEILVREKEYLWSDLIDCNVFDESNNLLGKVVNIISISENDAVILDTNHSFTFDTSLIVKTINTLEKVIVIDKDYLV
jgi:16S rRNA processing protein RimM